MATSTYTRASQNRTLDAATRLGHHWTQAELERVSDLDAQGLTDEQIALELGRSLFAIQSIHHVLAERMARGATTRTAQRVSAATKRFEQGFTDLAAWEASFA